MCADPSEIDALRTALAAAEARAATAEAEVVAAARERAVLAGAEATIAALRLEIEKLRRALYGTRSERKARLLDQLELQLEELEATATEDDLAAASARRGAQALPISPLAREAVTRIDAVFDAERAINGHEVAARLAVRQKEIAPLVADLEAWIRRERAGLSRHAPVAKAMDYMLKRRNGFARFLADGRACLTNNAAERALRGIALGRKAWLFAGSDRGGEGAAVMYSLIATAKLNDVDPQGLARRRPRPNCRHAGIAPRRSPAMALELRRSRKRCLTAALGGGLRSQQATGPRTYPAGDARDLSPP